MICLLCLCAERDEQLISLVSAESRQHNVAAVIYTHFRFCFQEEPEEGSICQKCWIKVSVFHEFYINVEYVHRSKESIFVESIIDDIKTTIDSENDAFIPFDDSPIIETDDPTVGPIKLEWTQHANDGPRPDVTATVSEQKLELKEEGSDDTDDGVDAFEQYFSEPASTDIKPPPKSTKKSQKPTRVKKEKPEGYVKRKWTRRQPKTDTKRTETKSKTFQCQTCELHFLSYNRLNRHIKEVHDVKEFKCSDSKCVDSFDTQQQLDDHNETKHKRSQCPHCDKLVLASFLAKHIENRHGTGHIICELCGKVSLNKQMHKDHYRVFHEVAQSLQCDICGQWLKNRTSMRCHMTNKHIYGPETCDLCGHLSPNRKALIEHKRLHKPGTKDRWKCDVCGHGFREKKKLAEHYHIHTGTAGSYNCEDCGKIFRFSSSFSVHKKKMHPKLNSA